MSTVLVRRMRNLFAGELLEPEDPGYEDARRLWNADIDRRPRLIVRCAGADDVRSAVRLARDEGLPVSVRGGGHGVGGHALVDDGLIVDLSLMKDIRVDGVRRIVRAEAGVVLGELDRACQEWGLATPAGIVTRTGISGLTLGGGIGWLMRKHGATVDNLIAAELVTADGELVRATPDDLPELFWALRGGGGNFGVVTSFELRLHEVGPVVLGGPVGYPLDDAREVLERYRDVVADTPDELTTILTLRRVPPLPSYPEEIHGRPVVNVTACYAGNLERGEAVVQPLRALGSPVYDLLVPRPFVQLQSLFDATVPWGWSYYWKSWEVADLSDPVIDLLVDAAERLPTRESYLIVFQLGGALARVPENATAFPQRSAGFNVNINGVWLPSAERDGPIRWTRELFDALAPLARGRAYVNFMGDEEPQRVRDAYGPERYARLAAVKRRFDPENVFRSNQNIGPSPSTG